MKPPAPVVPLASLNRQAESAERTVLGAAMLDPVVLGAYGVEAGDWLIPWHAECWDRLVTLRADPVASALTGADWTTAVLTAAWMWAEGHDARTGAKVEPSAVAALVRECPTPMAAAYALRVVRRCAQARRIYDACAAAMEAIAHGDDVGEVACGLLPVVTAAVPPPRVDDFRASLEASPDPLPAASPWSAHLPRVSP